MTVQRIGAVVRLRPGKRDEYERLHADVWPGVLARLKECHIGNYSIFVHDDLLFSYYEYTGDDLAADMARVAADPVTQEWWKLTDPCQEPVSQTPDGRPWTEMRSVFHLA
jgi:L-rhamnose mutarotase